MNSERNRKIKFRILALFFNHTLISKVVLGKELFICSNLGLLKKNHKVMAQVECFIGLWLGSDFNNKSHVNSFDILDDKVRA